MRRAKRAGQTFPGSRLSHPELPNKWPPLGPNVQVEIVDQGMVICLGGGLLLSGLPQLRHYFFGFGTSVRHF